jgi:hypothetical protein
LFKEAAEHNEWVDEIRTASTLAKTIWTLSFCRT